MWDAQAFEVELRIENEVLGEVGLEQFVIFRLENVEGQGVAAAGSDQHLEPDAPREIDEVLLSHPAVAESAVIGRPDPIKGENIKAFVILRVGHSASPELESKLKDHVRHVLGAIAVPAEIAFPDKLPKTRSGKIMRRLLKAQELGQEVGDISTLEE